MDTYKNKMVWYGISINEMVEYFKGTLLHFYRINFVVNSHFQDPGQFLINDNFTVD